MQPPLGAEAIERLDQRPRRLPPPRVRDARLIEQRGAGQPDGPARGVRSRGVEVRGQPVVGRQMAAFAAARREQRRGVTGDERVALQRTSSRVADPVPLRVERDRDVLGQPLREHLDRAQVAHRNARAVLHSPR